MTIEPSDTGFVKIKGHSIYYETYGDLASGAVPLLAVHGGPGSSHNYLLPLTVLSNQRPVILYDQLGTGRSQVPDSDSFYQIDYFVDELDELINQLKLKSIHLLGHSWGGMLVIEYLRTQRPHVDSVILSSAIIDSQLYAKETTRLLQKMGKHYPKLATDHEQAGTTGSSEYQDFYKVYKHKHLYRNGDMLPPE